MKIKNFDHLPGEASIDLICFPVSTSHIRIIASNELDAISEKLK